MPNAVHQLETSSMSGGWPFQISVAVANQFSNLSSYKGQQNVSAQLSEVDDHEICNELDSHTNFTMNFANHYSMFYSKSRLQQQVWNRFHIPQRVLVVKQISWQ